jgi:hypothetical protein
MDSGIDRFAWMHTPKEDAGSGKRYNEVIWNRIY